MNPEAIKAAALAWERGRALQKAGKYREAEPEFRAAMKVMPRSAALLADYGKLAEQLQEWGAAMKIWQAVAQADPQRAVGDHVGLALLQLNRDTEALPWLEAFAARYPDDADSAINLAVAYSRLFRDEDAIAVLRKAVQARPRHAHARESLITMLVNAADADGAAAALADALAHCPASKELVYLRMDHCLKHREFGAGFDLFDARWGTRFFRGNMQLPDRQRWDGTPFDGRLLVRAEQGVGDELIYSSVYGDTLSRHADTVIECDARLAPLFARAWPGTTLVPRTAPADDPRKAAFTHDIMAGDLCRFFRRSPDDFPVRDGWLRPDPVQAAALAADYRARFPGKLLVGLSWRSINPDNGSAKTLRLEQLLPVLRTPGVQCVDVQYGDTGAELAALLAGHGIAIHHDPAIDSLKDLDTFAAQLCALDVVVSTSNSTVHLAGALGVPTWVLVHRDRGLPWYWCYTGEHVPWYRHVELLRCTRRGEWEPVIAEAARRLAARARPNA